MGVWIPVKDGNPDAFALFRRHYSYNRKRDQMKFWPDGADKQFVGPGEKEVLITADKKAVFVWRKFISDAGETGVNCAVFRNEGTTAARSIRLIREAIRHARQRWPGERLYTYVDPEQVRAKKDPGHVFICAGFRKCGVTKSGKLIFEIPAR